MLEKELWISRLADAAEIDFCTSDKLWNTVLNYIERLLCQNKYILFSDKLCFYTKVYSEIYTTLPDSKTYILPPRIEIECSFPSYLFNKELVILLDTHILSELSNQEYWIVDRWCRAIDTLFAREISMGASIYFRGLAMVTPLMNGDIVIGLDVFIDDNLRSRVNKPFSMFEPVEVTVLDDDIDIEHIEIDSIDTFLDKHKEYLLLYEDNISEKIENTSVIVEEQEVSTTNKDLTKSIDNESDSSYKQRTIYRHDDTPCKKSKYKSYMWIVWIIVIVVLFLIFIFTTNIGGYITNIFSKSITCNILDHKNNNKNNNFVFIMKEDSSRSLSQRNYLLPDIISIKCSDSLSSNFTKYNIYRNNGVSKVSSTDKDTILGMVGDSNIISKDISIHKDKEEIITIKLGDRLALYSLHKYGKKVFWVYIYEENRDIIKDPDNIAIGTKLVLPAASKYKIDPNNNKSVHKALLLEKSIKENKN